MKFTYHLLNVFGRESDPFSGNPLCVVECVVEPGPVISDAQMQAIARQFNLSETVFLGESDAGNAADVDVRIFTPESELPFAGHPTLGTAFLVARLRGALGMDPEIRLRMKAGIIPVQIAGNLCTLTAKAPVSRLPYADDAAFAAAFGLNPADLGTDVLPTGTVCKPLWIHTGTAQLIVPVKTEEAVRRATPDYARLAAVSGGHANVHTLLFHMTSTHKITARFFFAVQGALREDAATGSACANLGGWLLAHGGTVPFSGEVSQGEAVHRPSTLHLNIDAQRLIRVGGSVRYLGKGEMQL